MNPEEANNQGQQQNQPNPQYNYPNYNTGGHLVTPNSVPVLVLGILTIVLCWCYGVISIILGIIAIILASAGEKEYSLNPSAYSLSSYKNLKAGKTCAIIGLCLSGLAILCFVIYVILVGTLAFNLFKFGLNN